MDAVEYIKEYKRMCDSIEKDCCVCDVYEQCLNREDYPKRFVGIVEKWAKEHPKKSRQNDFLKMFPNAVLLDGVVTIAPCTVDKTLSGDSCVKTTCEECTRKYWTEEIEE